MSDFWLLCSGSCGISGGHHIWEPMCDYNWYKFFGKYERVYDSGVVTEAVLMRVDAEKVVLCKSSVG